MLDTLKLVKGAVAQKDIVPALTHFYIHAGRIQGGNSRIAIDAPAPGIGIEGPVVVPAEPFIKAINNCADEPVLVVTEHRLLLRSGTFMVKLPLLPADQFPRAEPDSPEWETEGSFLNVLRALAPFISTDANQGWSIGMWLEEGWAYATNNAVLVRMPCDFLDNTGATINLPRFAVEELISIGREPVSFGVTPNSVTFHYDNGAWLKSQLIVAPWPVGKLRELFGAHNFPAIEQDAVGLADAVERIHPFCVNPDFPVIVFDEEGISTEEGDLRAAVSHIGKGFVPSKFNGNMLRLALEYATHFEVTADARRALFRRGNMDGIVVALLQ